jgi:CzcA family heavy metal efflux pump
MTPVLNTSGRGLQAALIAFSLRFRGIVIALATLVIAAGAYSVGHATYDVFPEFAPPQALIHTEAPGLSPDQVEVLVTQPLENALSGAPGLASLRSSSIQGLSIITANFDPGSDVLRDRQIVSERLASSIGLLPRQAQTPALTPLTSSTSTVLVAGLTSSSASLMDLRTSAEWLIKPTLMAVPGVAKVAIFGGGMRSLQIQVHPDRLVRLNIGLNDVTEAAARAAGVRGAGFIDSANQRIELKAEYPPLGLEDLKRAVLGSDTGPFATLGDVATVRFAPEPVSGGATIEGRPGVELVVSQQYGASTVDVTRRIQAALEGLRPLLVRDGVELDATLFRPADFIDQATGNVWSALLLGAVLVVAILAVFMADWRNAAVSCAAIPLSLLATLRLLQAFGVSVNTMTLGGLAVAIGVVVDDAVIDVENILRRMRANRLLAQPRALANVILDACLEVRSGVVYATFAVVLVVLPIVSLSGVAGRLFAPLGYAYALAIIASLLVSLTVIPALSLILFRPERMRAGEPPVLHWCRTRYQRLLARVTRYPLAVTAAALLLTALGAVAAAGFGVNFIPELKEGHLIVHMSAAPGTSIGESMRLGAQVSAALHELPAVRAVAQRVGRADKSDDILGSHYSEFDVDLKHASGAQLQAAQSSIRALLTQFPGVNFAMQSFLTERIEETLSGYTAAVAVNVIGPDLDALDRAARDVVRTLHRVRGATDVQLQTLPGTPQLSIRLIPAELQRWGLHQLDVLDLIRTAYEGATVGQSYEGNRAVSVIVVLEPGRRNEVWQIGELPLRTPDGRFVRLAQVAQIHPSEGRYEVTHQGGQRMQTVTANVRGRDVGGFVAELRRQLAVLNLPAGTHLEFAGEAQAQARSERDLLAYSAVAALGIVLLISIIARSGRNLAIVLANLPFAFVGGVAAVAVTGGVLSLGSMVGLVALFGITLRNSILIVAHYDRLVRVEGRTWGVETVIEGAADRLAPILMTTLVTALGLLPLAIGINEPGREIEGAMAVVILGGLLTSMALNLLVLPALALRFGRFDPPVLLS